MAVEVKKPSCEDACEHHKGSHKCNCVYCNVFEKPLATPHMHKSNKTRNRLRTRLNQKREKIDTSVNKVNKQVPEASSVNIKLASNNNPSLDNTVKMTGSSKIATVNNNISNKNNNAKVNVKSANAGVPEALYSGPSLSNVKSVFTSVKPKITTLTNGHVPNSSIQKASDDSFVKRFENGSQSLEFSTVPSSSSLNFDDSRDINELLNYIEGNKNEDKAVLVQKKADKKARQRFKKAQEKERIETEKRLEVEARLKEEKDKEEERLKAEALAKQLIERQKRNEKYQEGNKAGQKQGSKKNKKKGKNNSNASTNNTDDKPNVNVIEKTVPAMITIKRITEGADSPATVTITLRGSTPESDDLLFTLLNGHNNNQEHLAIATISSDKTSKSNNNSTIKSESHLNDNDLTDTNQKISKKKKKKQATSEVPSKELNVTIAGNKNNVDRKKNKKPNKNTKVPDPKNSNVPEIKVKGLKENINLSMFHLPSGITFTKIDGLSTNINNTTLNSNVPVSKSNKENLVQHTNTTANNNKKNKKKNKKKQDQKSSESDGASAEIETSNTSGSSMVTLKNPLFHAVQATLSNQRRENRDLPIFPSNQQASIVKNENGMLTIRSPGLQNSRENGFPISNFLCGTSSVPISTTVSPTTPSVPIPHNNSSGNNEKSSLKAQEILSGLPEIVITKVDKSALSNGPKYKKPLEPDEVSITITTNGPNSTADIKLEAYNQFCQEAVSTKRKGKVGHLNIKDVIRNNKRDITYA